MCCPPMRLYTFSQKANKYLSLPARGNYIFQQATNHARGSPQTYANVCYYWHYVCEIVNGLRNVYKLVISAHCDCKLLGGLPQTCRNVWSGHIISWNCERFAWNVRERIYFFKILLNYLQNVSKRNPNVIETYPPEAWKSLKRICKGFPGQGHMYIYICVYICSHEKWHVGAFFI